jgi:hypothetical protein
MTRVFESAVDLVWSPSVAYGEDEIPPLPASPLAAVVVLFNLSATPERENHGAFIAALAARVAAAVPLIAIVDTTEFERRFGDQPARIAERRGAWEQALAAQGIAPLFVRLAEPDLPEAARALATRVERAAQ